MRRRDGLVFLSADVTARERWVDYFRRLHWALQKEKENSTEKHNIFSTISVVHFTTLQASPDRGGEKAFPNNRISTFFSRKSKLGYIEPIEHALAIKKLVFSRLTSCQSCVFLCLFYGFQLRVRLTVRERPSLFNRYS
jgi:hypothetical protein